MSVEVANVIMNQVCDILDRADLKYRKTKFEDETQGIELVFKNKSNETIKTILYVSQNPNRINIFTYDLYTLPSNLKDREIDVLRKVNQLNTEKMLFGNLGYDIRYSNLVYSNTISLGGRGTIEATELLDYVIYTSFIAEQVENEMKKVFE
jgi:hypothetical protein